MPVFVIVAPITLAGMLVQPRDVDGEDPGLAREAVTERLATLKAATARCQFRAAG